MPRVTLNLVGETYGRLLVLEEVEPYILKGKIKDRKYKCQCQQCGNEIVIRQSHLRSKDRTGVCSSCAARARATTHGHKCNNKATKLYYTWRAMKDRCYNLHREYYPNYGGRGITVYEGWIDDFQAFADYVGEPPGSNSQLDRIDNDGNYEPGNVHWTTARKNCENRRSSRSITVNGITYPTLKRASEALGVNYSTLKSRYYKGLPLV